MYLLLASVASIASDDFQYCSMIDSMYLSLVDLVALTDGQNKMLSEFNT